MKQRFVVMAFVSLFATAACASTVDISFTSPPQNQANGHYVGNSLATVGTQHVFELLCGDMNHTTNIPSGPFTFFVSTLPSLTDARFTGADMLTTYETAAILLFQFDSLGVVDNYTAGSYQFAIWKLFTPSAGDYGNSASLVASAKITVAGGGIQSAYNSFRVFTPTLAARSNQEFLGMDFGNQIVTQTPEPASYLTIGAGLLLFAAGFRRRMSI